MHNTGLTICSYKASHALEIIAGQAKQPSLEVDELTTEWAKAKETRGPAVTALWHGKVVACGGLEILWPGMAEGWCAFSEEVDKNTITARALFAKETKRILEQWVEEYKLVRIQAPMRADFPQALRFAKFLGLNKNETPEGMLCYHPDGTTGYMYSLIITR